MLKTLTLLCSTCAFSFFLFNSFPNVVPEWKYDIIKTKVSNRYEYSVPVHEYINWNFEQVTIFFPMVKNFRKNHLYAVKCLHIICPYTAVCFSINMILFYVYLAQM